MDPTPVAGRCLPVPQEVPALGRRGRGRGSRREHLPQHGRGRPSGGRPAAVSSPRFTWPSPADHSPPKVCPADGHRCNRPGHHGAREGGEADEADLVVCTVTKSDADWRASLSPEAYLVCRQKGTEAPWSGECGARAQVPGVSVVHAVVGSAGTTTRRAEACTSVLAVARRCSGASPSQ